MCRLCECCMIEKHFVLVYMCLEKPLLYLNSLQSHQIHMYFHLNLFQLLYFTTQFLYHILTHIWNNYNVTHTCNNQNAIHSCNNQNATHTCNNENVTHTCNNQNVTYTCNNQNVTHTCNNQNVTHTCNNQNVTHTCNNQNVAHIYNIPTVTHNWYNILLYLFVLTIICNNNTLKVILSLSYLFQILKVATNETTQ